MRPGGNDTHACGELYGFGGPDEDEVCYDSDRLDVPDDVTVFR